MMREPPLPGDSFLTPASEVTLVEQIVYWYRARIDERVIRPGSRMPSIRRFADEHRVSRFTVVEAYDRLVARGYLESRRGAGFFVRERAPAQALASVAGSTRSPATEDQRSISSSSKVHGVR